jgi:hypothetical protein
MTRMLRKNIEKCIGIFIFIEFERWDFSGDDFGEDRSHDWV